MAGSVAFVVVSVLLWSWAGTDAGPINLVYMRTVAVIAAAFFSLTGIYAATKLFDRRPGLVIDRSGIIDNASAVAAGRIPWSEIDTFHVTMVGRQRFLTVVLNDPEPFIRRLSAPKRWLVSANARFTGSPINIGTTSLQIDFATLCDTLVAFQPDAGE